MKNQKVIFLGAGASKVFGLPLTNEIFPIIINKAKKKQLFNKDEVERLELLEFINLIFPGISDLDDKLLPNITDVLSLIDHLLVNFQKPMVLKKNLSYYRDLLERAIIEVLDIKLFHKSLLDDHNIPLTLTRFVKFIYSNHKDIYQTIISTNYDISIETELFRIMNDWDKIDYEIDFGINWRYPFKGIKNQPSQPLMSIYKLHGSLNWLKCDLCDHIYINTLGSITHQAYRKDIDEMNTCTCGNFPLKPLIVAPSIERAKIDVNLQHIWQSSLEKLREADEWLIIGYSLPTEDLNIKSIFIRALNGRDNYPKITVVQKGIESKSRYDTIFKKYIYYEKGLVDYLDTEMDNYYAQYML